MSASTTVLSGAKAQIYERNKAYAKPSEDGYKTKLSPADDQKFMQWVKSNKVPYDPSPTSDYDMKGFWQGLVNGDPHAKTEVNKNDNKMHFTDWWKTPYHESFSADSQYAGDKAPMWNDKDQLVAPDGMVIFDEPAVVAKRKAAETINKAMGEK